VGAPAKRTVHVVLPAYDEEANIGGLLRRIRETLVEEGIAFSVIVVDDGSRDRTAAIVEEQAREMPVMLLRHERNQGLGATIRDGLHRAATVAGPRDIVVTMDADETHTPGLIVRMVRLISEGHDVVIASRYRAGSRSVGVPLSRRALSWFGSCLFRVTFPTRGVRDFTSGFRAYRAEVIRAAIAEYGEGFVDQDGFQCMVDILLKLRKMQVVIGEVPFVLRYDFKEGGTKMDVGGTAVRTLGLVLRRRLGR
jgi:dolichol-phosphate mannosyltransferase